MTIILIDKGKHMDVSKERVAGKEMTRIVPTNTALALTSHNLLLSMTGVDSKTTNMAEKLFSCQFAKQSLNHLQQTSENLTLDKVKEISGRCSWRRAQ